MQFAVWQIDTNAMPKKSLEETPSTTGDGRIRVICHWRGKVAAFSRISTSNKEYQGQLYTFNGNAPAILSIWRDTPQSDNHLEGLLSLSSRDRLRVKFPT